MQKWQIWGFCQTEEFDFLIYFFFQDGFSRVLRLEAQTQVTGSQTRV